MKMRTYLVTGSAGFIGSNFVLRLLGRHSDVRVVSVDALTYAGDLRNLQDVRKHPHHEFVRADIRDRKCMRELILSHHPDVIVNFAAESHVDRSIVNPVAFAETNTGGTVSLLDAALEAWQQMDGFEDRRFVQISTDEVYGSLGLNEGRRFVETDPLDPRSPYSASKASADLFARAYHTTYGLPVLITRCTNNYGPRQYPEKLIPVTIKRALAHEPIPLYGDGRHVREWMHVNDHCLAIESVVERGVPGEIYNIGAGEERANREIVCAILDMCRRMTGDEAIRDDLIAYVEDRKGHDRRYAIDASKIASELGWRPLVSFEQGLEETVRWYVERYRQDGEEAGGQRD